MPEENGEVQSIETLEDSWEDIGKEVFPFTAVVGQETMKRALLLNIINPDIGGVLIRGDKGTGKSIIVRGLREILPSIRTFEGCNHVCDPNVEKFWCEDCKENKKGQILKEESRDMVIVDIPLNISEDRLVGSIDVEKVLTEGKKAFEAGILAGANRNVLYVDEINLLGDNIVDLLLDVAAMGVVTVEREGISVSYYSKFILIGSMNPEEGELRPQLLDRFPLQAIVTGVDDVEERVKIIQYTSEFKSDPKRFRRKFELEQQKVRDSIREAKKQLPKVTTPEEIMELIAQICIDFNVDGHRADIIIEKAARTNAAFEGHDRTTVEDVIVTSEMVLPHRMRKKPFEEEEFSSEMLRKLVKKYTTESGTVTTDNNEVAT